MKTGAIEPPGGGCSRSVSNACSGAGDVPSFLPIELQLSILLLPLGSAMMPGVLAP